MAAGPIKQNRLEEYHRNGYIVEKALFDREEIELLRRAAKEDRQLDQHSFGKGDGEGGKVRLSLWNHPGDTIYGMFARCERIVDSAEKLLGRRGLPLPLQDDHEGRQGRRRVGLASGLRLLVSERRALPAPHQRLHCRRSGHPRERLSAGDSAIPCTRPHRPRPHWRSGRRRHGARATKS